MRGPLGAGEKICLTQRAEAIKGASRPQIVPKMGFIWRKVSKMGFLFGAIFFPRLRGKGERLAQTKESAANPPARFACVLSALCAVLLCFSPLSGLPFRFFP